MGQAVLARKTAAGPVATRQAAKAESSGLRIGEPNDVFEQEADRVADEIMAGGSSRAGWSLARVPIDAPLQRKCACGGSGGAEEECEECKKKEMMLQRQATGHGGPAAAPPIVHEVLRSPGQSLDAATRAFFEPRFRYDLSQVRVHTDARAAQSARAVNAVAYTLGRDIVFHSNSYEPGAPSGRRLLAHELAHVVQQDASGSLSGATTRSFVTPQIIQRQTRDKECTSGNTEGAGVNIRPPVTAPDGSVYVYGVWGTWEAGDSPETCRTRALGKWLDWRFGKLPIDRRNRVMDFVTRLAWTTYSVPPKAGCNWPIAFDSDTYAHIRVVAGEAVRAQAPPSPDTPLLNVAAGNRPGGGPPPAPEGEKREERGAPVSPNWKVLEGNEELSRQYLLWMQHFAGMPKSGRADELAGGGLTETEILEIIGEERRYWSYTDLITQGFDEFQKAGGKTVDGFSPLIELVLQQYTWGNPTATSNYLKIGKGDSWVPEERGMLGVTDRRSGLLLYDSGGNPLRSITGQMWRDHGYVGAPQPGWGINIADIKDPALAGILNMLRQNVGDPVRQAAEAARVLFDNIDLVKFRVAKGLSQEIIDKFEDTLPMFAAFLAAHGLSQLLIMSANPYLVAVGGALEGLVTAAGYIMDIDFAASATDRLLLAARYLARVTRDDKGNLTTLSEHYLDLAAVPLRDMVSDIAMMVGMGAFGRLLGAIKGEAKERPRIECHSCAVEPKPGEATKPPETKAEPAVGVTTLSDALVSQIESTKEARGAVIQEIADLSQKIKALAEAEKAHPTPEGREALKAMRAELEELTGTPPKGVRPGRPGELTKLAEKLKKLDEQLRKSKLSLYDKIRAATPSTKAAEAALRKASGFDQVSGKPSPRLTVDHIVSVKDIVQMKGFDKLSWENQKVVADMADNLIAMDGPANSSKGDRSWPEWPQWSDYYKDPKIKSDMDARDAVLRTKIQAEIDRLQPR
jgi:hypothetical protein